MKKEIDRLKKRVVYKKAIGNSQDDYFSFCVYIIWK